MSVQSNYPRPNLGFPNGETCPQCGQVTGKRIRYTWWGGAVGPALLSLTKCQSCGFQFNAKTGLSTKKAIIIYNVIAISLAIIFIIAASFLKS